MTEEMCRPWLEIPIPDYTSTDPEERRRPKTHANEEDDEPIDKEDRVIIINL
jgi:hypothetical protein